MQPEAQSGRLAVPLLQEEILMEEVLKAELSLMPDGSTLDLELMTLERQNGIGNQFGKVNWELEFQYGSLLAC